MPAPFRITRATRFHITSAIALAVALQWLSQPVHGAMPGVQQAGAKYPVLLATSADRSLIAERDAVATVPDNLVVPETHRGLIAEMWERSPTFRRQANRIRANPSLVVRLYMSSSLTHSRGRAATEFQRRDGGIIEADVYLAARPSMLELAELIGHELEHILEQLDGVDLPQLSRLVPKQVWASVHGDFETARAIRTGRTVAAEVSGGR